MVKKNQFSHQIEWALLDSRGNEFEVKHCIIYYKLYYLPCSLLLPGCSNQYRKKRCASLWAVFSILCVNSKFLYVYYSKYFKAQCLVWCSSENGMGMSNIHIFCPLTNWYCKITSNSTWFWHDIRIFIFKLCTLRPKRNAIFTENDPISEASGWQSSAFHSKNCIAHVWKSYLSWVQFNNWC